MNDTNNDKNAVVEGEVISTSKRPVVKSYKRSDLPLKQRKFVEYYKETGNGTKAAIKAGYSELSAGSQASRLLKKDKVLAILNDSITQAEDVIKDLMTTSDNPQIQLAAAKEVLDRTIGKPIQRSESVSVNITVESMLNSES